MAYQQNVLQPDNQAILDVNNPSHVLFLHPSDNPNNVLVTELLNGTNYGHWRKSMEIALISKNKLGFVLGTCTKPGPDSPMASLADHWDRCDKMVISWLINAVVKDIGQSILFSTSARDVWLQLEQRFGEANGTKIFRILRELYVVSQNNLSVADYFTQIKKMWDDYNSMITIPHCDCGINCANLKAATKMIKDQELMQFLVGLNDDYKVIRGSILMMKPLPSIDQVYQLIAQEEKQRSLSALSQISNNAAAFHAGEMTFPNSHNAMAVQQRSFNTANPYKSYGSSSASTFGNALGNNFGGNQGPYSGNSTGYKPPSKPTGQDRRQFFCDHCKIAGHSVQRCYKLHGYPPGHRLYKGKKMAASVHNDQTSFTLPQDAIPTQQHALTLPSLTAEQYSQLLQLLSKHSSDMENTTGNGDVAAGFLAGKRYCMLASFANKSWIVDSGASDHITPDLSLLHNVKRIQSACYITMPNGKKASIKHVGHIQLAPNLVLDNVLHVPEFQFNLLSISRLTKQFNTNVIFTPSTCLIQDPTMQTVTLGNEHRGLYFLQQKSQFKGLDKGAQISNSHMQQQSTISGTACFSDAELWHFRLGHLSFTQLKHIDATTCNNQTHGICQICPLAKMHRLGFSLSTSRAKQCFDLIHVDIWGPYTHSTYEGAKYFLTIVDDCSRATWVHLMAHKSNAFPLLKAFIIFVENQFGLTVKIIRSDNGMEFKDNTALTFYKDKGISHQTSCVDTPQQNGVVERKHQHLLEVSRALMLQSKLPIQYWGQALLTATYLINRMPTAVLGHLTPFEILYKEKPHYDHLKTFGCLCYASTLKRHRDKLQPRARPCVFLGYPYGQKAYKLLDLQTKQIFTSRDVQFHERVFPFHHFSSQPDVPLPNVTTFIPEYPNLPVPMQAPSSVQEASFTEDAPSFLETPSSSEQPSTTPSLPPSPSTTAPISQLPARRTTRQSQPPRYLQDYFCGLVQSDQLPSEHHALVTTLSQYSEPQSYEEAAKDPAWVAAMNKEIDALILNNTWDFVDLPPGKKAISCKWVYKVKLHSDGSLERFKARLVIRGFTQKYGIDYQEVFSPVVKMATIRSIIALAASKGWHLFQLDVNNAFLHGELDEEVYMEAPKGIYNPAHKVCKLKKSLYGLKQASRQWFSKLSTTLLYLGYQQSKNDYSLFINKSSTDITIIAVYVDDIMLTGSNPTEIHHVKQHLHNLFGIKDLGKLHYFLGLEISYTNDGIVLSQRKFTMDLLKDSGLDTSKVASTPLPVPCKLVADKGELLVDPTRYRTLVGKLNFLTHSRPDLSFTAQTLSQFMQKPTTIHLQALYHTLRYIQGTIGQGILLKASDHLSLQAYSDSDWAACPSSRRSITGYLIHFGVSPISWRSKKQSTVSKSSSEAEYRAMSQAAAEVTWLVRLFEELGVHSLKPVTLHCDNQSAIHIGKNPVFHERTKHIEIDCHFTRDKVLEGLLQLAYLPTEHQLADVLTKALSSPQQNLLLHKLGMVPYPHHSSLRGGDETDKRNQEAAKTTKS